MTRPLFSALAALLIMLAAPAAKAATVTLAQPRVATDILGLNVLGTFYDVHFNNIASSTFLGNPAGATAARDAIVAALNTTAADLVRIQNTGVTVNNFGIQDGPGGSVRGVSFSIPNNWQSSSSTALAAPIAQFTVVPAPVPLPATLPVLVMACLSMVALSRRRRSSHDWRLLQLRRKNG